MTQNDLIEMMLADISQSKYISDEMKEYAESLRGEATKEIALMPEEEQAALAQSITPITGSEPDEENVDKFESGLSAVVGKDSDAIGEFLEKMGQSFKKDPGESREDMMTRAIEDKGGEVGVGGSKPGLDEFTKTPWVRKGDGPDGEITGSLVSPETQKKRDSLGRERGAYSFKDFRRMFAGKE